MMSFVYNVHILSQLFPDAGNNAVVISLQDGPVVCGDVKVMFESNAVSQLSLYVYVSVFNLYNWLIYNHVLYLSFLCAQGLPKGYEDCPFYFWFNTSFIENNR